MKAIAVAAVFGLCLAGSALHARDIKIDDWRSSWTEFARVVEQYASSSSEIPRGNLGQVRTGRVVPSSTDVMRRFGGPVTFEGVVKSVETRDLLAGHAAKVKIDIARPKWRWRVHVYPKASALDQWTAIAPGTRVTFQATVTGLSLMPPDGVYSDNGYILVLEDATVSGPASATSTTRATAASTTSPAAATTTAARTTGATSPAPAGAMAALSSARAKWANEKPESYEFTFQLTCYCPTELQRRVRFRVTQGQSRQLTATSDTTRRAMERYDSIDKLWSLLDRVMADQPVEFEARYDAVLGYPQSVGVTRRGVIVDDHVSFTVTGFRPIR
jgi:hypothetical protein